MTKPKRILHIVRQYHPAVGGLEAYVQNMSRHQRRLGHDCEILTLNRVFHGQDTSLPAREQVDGALVHRVPFLGRRRFFIPLVPPSFFRPYDILHVHNTDGFFDCVGLLAAGKPLFATTHGGFFHTKDFSAVKKAYFSLVTRHTGKRYNALFATSQNDHDTFRGINDNLVLKPNAIVPPGDFIAEGKDFVYLGRLAQHKNVPGLIRAFAHLRPAARLHIIGPEWDVTRAALSALARRLGVEKDVILHGYVTPHEMQTILKGCGWFLSASAFEGFGMSMLEAMAVGLIPFVQPNESFRELIASGGVGACVDFTDPAQAARLIAQKTGACAPADRAKARAFALLFSWEKLAEDTLKAYEEFG